MPVEDLQVSQPGPRERDHQRLTSDHTGLSPEVIKGAKNGDRIEKMIFAFIQA